MKKIITIIIIILIFIILLNLFKHDQLLGGELQKIDSITNTITGVKNISNLETSVALMVNDDKFHKVMMMVPNIKLDLKPSNSIEINTKEIQNIGSKVMKYITVTTTNVTKEVNYMIKHTQKLISAPEIVMAEWIGSNPFMVLKLGISGQHSQIQTLLTIVKSGGSITSIKSKLFTIFGSNYSWFILKFYIDQVYSKYVKPVENIILSFSIGTKISLFQFLNVYFNRIILSIESELGVKSVKLFISKIINTKGDPTQLYNVVLEKLHNLILVFKNVLINVIDMMKCTFSTVKSFISKLKSGNVTLYDSKMCPEITILHNNISKKMQNKLLNSGYKIKVLK